MKMYRKIILLVFVLLIVITSFYLGKNFGKEEVYLDERSKQIKQENTLSMMLETEAGSGNYEMTTASSWPTEGYVFNSELSKCENGGELSWDDVNKKVLMSGNVSDKCYVYFDVYAPPALAEYVISQYNGVQGNNNIYFHDNSLANGAGDNSYRYSGSSDTTKNYVCFGSNASSCPKDNLYRIIGVFSGQVKLIKATLATSDLLGTNGPYYGGNKYGWTSLSSCSTDVAYNNVNEIISLANKNIIAAPGISSGAGCNKWKYSELNKLNLNTNYINNIGALWASKIDNTEWIISSISGSLGNFSSVNNIYSEEINSPDETYGPNDGISKIGLMYVSDYGYAAIPDAWTTSLSSYSNSAITALNWMYIGDTEWTISRSSNDTGSSSSIFSTGYLNTSDTQSNQESPYVRPTFYLNPDVSYRSGSGTKSDPIIIN